MDVAIDMETIGAACFGVARMGRPEPAIVVPGLPNSSASGDPSVMVSLASIPVGAILPNGPVGRTA
jgi:hypothetical protein